MTRIAVALVALLLAGCHVPIGHFTVLGDPARLVPGAPATRTRTTGESCRWWVLGVTLGVPSMQEAIDDALANAGASGVLADVDLVSEHPVYGLAGKHCYVVSGTPWTSAPVDPTR
jgi:hypothetical protein